MNTKKNPFCLFSYIVSIDDESQQEIIAFLLDLVQLCMLTRLAPQ